MDPSDDFPSARDFLADARSDFRQFYATATPTDTGLMDGLVMAHAALVVGINTSRDNIVPVIRSELEKVTDSTERLFTELREAVRACPTFNALIAAERTQVERAVFQVNPPWEQ